MRVFFGLAASAVVCVAGVPAGAQSFTPGMLYTTYDGGFAAMNLQLQVQGYVVIPGVETASGCVFNRAGNLVMLARVNDQPSVIEVSAAGQILNSVPTGSSTFLRGSYIDYDPLTNRYVFANDHQITLLDGNLATITSSASNFTRASGVAFGPDGLIYATDQFEGILHRYAANLTELAPVTIGGFTRTDIDFATTGNLLLADFSNDNIQQRNQTTGVLTTLVSGFRFVSALEALPDGTFVGMSSSHYTQRFTATGQLMYVGQFLGPNGGGVFGDGLAYFVPAPGTAALLGIVSITALRRRR